MVKPGFPEHIFVYGMQSSGASLFTYFLAQRPNSVAIIDLWANSVAPALVITPPAILKAVVCETIRLEQHLDTYQPDFKILFLRNPLDVYGSLQNKEYRDICGNLEEKFRMLEATFLCADELFNAVVQYETFVHDPIGVAARLNELGIPISNDAHLFPRSLDQIAQFNQEHSEWCRETFNTHWRFGSIHADQLLPLSAMGQAIADAETMDRLWAWCPGVMTLYERMSTK